MTAPDDPQHAAALNNLRAVADVFADNATRRELRARTALATLRRYERRIVWEAAVMGFVLGDRHGRVNGYRYATDARIDDKFPHDTDIVLNVIEHCDSTADLYPYIADACNGRRRRVTRARLFHPEEPR